MDEYKYITNLDAIVPTLSLFVLVYCCSALFSHSHIVILYKPCFLPFGIEFFQAYYLTFKIEMKVDNSADLCAFFLRLKC